MDGKTCETCRFYNQGYCKRFPPVIPPLGSDGRDYNRWPVVSTHEWCGEWDAKPVERA